MAKRASVMLSAIGSAVAVVVAANLDLEALVLKAVKVEMVTRVGTIPEAEGEAEWEWMVKTLEPLPAQPMEGMAG